MLAGDFPFCLSTNLSEQPFIIFFSSLEVQTAFYLSLLRKEGTVGKEKKKKKIDKEQCNLVSSRQRCIFLSECTELIFCLLFSKRGCLLRAMQLLA